MKRVIVHIDRLVLRGFDHEDRHAIAAGLQQELARLFAEPHAAQQLTARGDVSRMRVGSININPGSKPQGVGVDAARRIGQEMKTT
jgi:hypothetical protein